MKKKIVIGVTGGLATGKTLVAEVFASKGAAVIDADLIAHEILEDAAVRENVLKAFGPGVLSDGRIDRAKLRREVFGDKKKIANLNAIMHPVILRRINEETEKIKEGVVVVDAPLLVESGLSKRVDVVVVVTADHRSQLERAAAKGMSEEEAKSIISEQMPLSEKVKFADFVIDNSGDAEETKKGAEKIWKKIQNR